MKMKFAILLLAFFIPLLTSTNALFKCYKCISYPGRSEGESLPELEQAGARSGVPRCDNRKSDGIEVDCESQYCFTSARPDNKQLILLRGCKDGNGTGLQPGCGPAGSLEACLCNSHLCNGEKRGIQQNGHTKIVGMSLTNLLGGVLALLLIK